MIALQVEDIREFTRQLFMAETFDRFLVQEARFTTFAAFTVDGRLHQDFFTDEELEQARLEDYATWQMVRPFCFSLIKGKKQPESFHIILRLPPQGAARFMAEHAPNLREDAGLGLYINIRYEEKLLYCVTGVSFSQFTMDKTLERAWDENVERFLKKNGIAAGLS